MFFVFSEKHAVGFLAVSSFKIYSVVYELIGVAALCHYFRNTASSDHVTQGITVIPLVCLY